MDGLSILLGILTTVFLVLVIGMNTIQSLQPVSPIGAKEGFLDSQPAPESSVETQIRTILDPMAAPELCPLFEKVRANMSKNEAVGPTPIPPEEVTRRVEKALALAIPGGALPCPLLQYPKSGSTDLEWLDFLQKVPVDFGARVVFMALYARNTLVKTRINLEGQLARMKNRDIKVKIAKALGTVPEPLTEEEKAQDDAQEGFALLCPPTVADTRRAEKAAKGQEACALPEDLKPEEIQEAVTTLLKQIVAKKSLLLKEKGVDPTIDIRPILKQAQEAAGALDVKGKQAEAGTLLPTP